MTFCQLMIAKAFPQLLLHDEFPSSSFKYIMPNT